MLPDGRVITRLGGLLKDNAGLDLPNLLIGSEGILAVITRGRGSGSYRPGSAGQPHCSRSRISKPGLRFSIACAARRPRSRRWTISSNRACGESASTSASRRRSRPYPVYLSPNASPTLIPPNSSSPSTISSRRARSRPTGWTPGALELPRGAQRDRPLPRRAAEAGCLGSRGRRSRLRAARASSRRGGHRRRADPVRPSGDGNVHVNVLGAGEPAETLEDLILNAAASHGGSISAEHGVGVAKTRWLGLCRSEAEISVMRDVKNAFDPGGVLIPVAFFPSSETEPPACARGITPAAAGMLDLGA